MQRINGHLMYLMNVRHTISQAAMLQIERQKQLLPQIRERVFQLSKQHVDKKRFQLALLQQKTADASPDKLLARGYSITLKDGKVVKDAALLHSGDEIVTRLKQGEAISIVK